MTDRFCLTLAPVLGRNRHESIANSQSRLIYQKKDLVYGRRTGKGALAITSQHDIVQHIDTVRHQVLQGDHDKQAEQGFIELLVFGKK